MSEIFARYLEAGIFGSVIILLVLVLRICLQKAPRRILCLLWLLAVVRLLLPFQLESRLSLQPDLDDVAVFMEQEQSAPVINVGLPENHESVPDLETVTQPQVQLPVNDMQQHTRQTDTMDILSYIWLGVACSAVIYMLISYMILKLRVREAVRGDDGIMECDRIRGAFLLGYIRPRIYLPFRVKHTDRQFIIAHEQAHIARGDNWWKLLGFLCACVHWYNPLVWLAYILLCKDIELACDERVIRHLNVADRKGYSMALLNCAKGLSGALICPVAFGEVSLKARIKSILRYRKPGLWITVTALLLITATAVCFLTSPMADALPLDSLAQATEPFQPEQTAGTTEPETVPQTVPQTDPEPTEGTTAHVHSYTVQTVAPTCTSGGFDLHTCACGDQFMDNTVPALEHRYRKVATSGIYGRFVCENCADEYWKEEAPANTSNGSVESQLTTYAASFGFDMNFTGSKVEARRFDYTFSSYVDKEMLLNTGRSLIKDAYQYCLDNGLDVSKQMCCVVVNRPSYSVNVTDTSVGWSSPSSWQRYSIRVYILQRDQGTNSDVIDPGTNNSQAESTEPQFTEPPAEVPVPETTAPSVEPTVPETTEPTETLPAEEECLTAFPGMEDAAEPIRENNNEPEPVS